MLTSLAGKLVAAILAATGLTVAASDVTGASTPSVLSIILNIAGGTAAWFAATRVAMLRRKIEDGDTPSTQVAVEVRQVVTDLREVVLDLREGLARTGTIERRTPPDPPSSPARRETDT